MEEMFQLLEEEFSGYTTREVKMHICKDRQLSYDSIFLIDNNGSLLTAAYTQIETDKIKEIHVYNLEGFYKSSKQKLKNLEKELENKGKDLEELDAKLKVVQKEKVELKQQIIQISIEKSKELASIEQNLNQAQMNEQEKFKQQLQQCETLMMASKQQLEEQLNKVNAENEKIKQEFGQLQSLMEVEKMDFAKKQEYWLQQKEKIEQSTLEQFQANQALEAQKKQYEIYIAQFDQHNKELEKQLEENKNQFEETSRSIFTNFNEYIEQKIQRPKGKFEVNKDKFEGLHTIREVKMKISKEYNLPYDSFFLLNENQQLLSAANLDINLNKIRAIVVHQLQDYYLEQNKLENELHSQIEQLRIEIESKDTFIKQQEMKINNTLKQYELQVSKSKLQLEQIEQFNIQKEQAKYSYDLIFGQLNAEKDTVRQLNLDKEKAKTDFDQKLKELTDQREVLQNQLAVYKQQLNSIQNSETSLKSEIEQLIGQKITAAQNYEQLLGQFNTEIHKFKMDCDKMIEELSSQNKSDKIQFNSEIKKLTTEKEDQKNKLLQQINSAKSEEIVKLKKQQEQFNYQIKTQQKQSDNELQRVKQSHDELQQIQLETQNKLKSFDEAYQMDMQKQQISLEQLQFELSQSLELKYQYEQCIQQQTNDLFSQNQEISQLKQNIESQTLKQNQQNEAHAKERIEFEKNIYDNQNKFEQLSANCIQQQNENHQLQQQLSQVYLQLKQFYSQNTQLTEEKTGLETQLKSKETKHQTKIADLQSNIEEFEKQVKSQKATIEEKEQHNQQLFQTKKKLEKDLEETTNQLEKAKRAIKVCEQEKESLQKNLTGMFEKETVQLKNLIRELKNKNESLNFDMTTISKQFKEQKDKEFQEIKKANIEQLESSEAQLAACKKELQKKTKDNIELENKLFQSDKQLNYIKSKFDTQLRETQQKDKELEELKEKITK